MSIGRSRTTANPEAAIANPNPAVGARVHAVLFDRVLLAFEDNVVLRDLSFPFPLVTWPQVQFDEMREKARSERRIR